MDMNNTKKFTMLISILIVLAGLLYYINIHTEPDKIRIKNSVNIKYSLAVSMENNNNSCTFYLPGYQNKERQFLDINNDIIINGNYSSLSHIETIHGVAFKIIANGSFILSLNNTYKDKIYINDTGYNRHKFWNFTLFELDNISINPSINYYVGHFWIYYNGSGCQDNISITINEIAHFRFYYHSGAYNTIDFTGVIRPIGWNNVSVKRTF